MPSALTQSSEFLLADEEIFSAYVDEQASSLTKSGGRAQLRKWIVENTAHPTDQFMPWTFDDHEYQIGILECLHPHVSTMKAAQVGVSELSVRIALGMSQLSGRVNGIYVLPTTGFARKFAVNRIDPTIKASKRLKTLLNKDVDNNELKQIGDSFLFIAGAQKTSQAISIPARYLIRDEYDFCEQDVLTSYQSRLQHNKEGEESQWDFSTPTAPGFGISQRFNLGTQFVYLCWHEGCGKWTVVDPLNDIVIPGFEDRLELFTRQDLQSETVHVGEAKVLCQQCRGEIKQENLANPERRAWVARYPDRGEASFYVSPLDVAAINTPAKVLKAREQYKTTADWINFSFGQPFENAENSILEETLDSAFCVRGVSPSASTGVYGAALGMDVGKLSHLWVGKKVGDVLEVVHGETIRQTMDNSLKEIYCERHRQYNALRGVVDAAPDVTVPGMIRAELPYNQAWGAYYVRGKGKADLNLYEEKEGEGVVNIMRTRMIDEMVKDFNAGKILLPMGMKDEETVRRHLKAVKRINPNDNEDSAFWSSNGEDHYFMALVYLYTATKMLEDDSSVVVFPAGVTLVSKVKLKQSIT